MCYLVTSDQMTLLVDQIVLLLWEVNTYLDPGHRSKWARSRIRSQPVMWPGFSLYSSQDASLSGCNHEALCTYSLTHSSATPAEHEGLNNRQENKTKCTFQLFTAELIDCISFNSITRLMHVHFCLTFCWPISIDTKTQCSVIITPPLKEIQNDRTEYARPNLQTQDK